MAVTSQPESADEEMGLRELRTPPHSVEAEQAVLGGLMLDNSAWDKIGDVVVADDFYRRDHRLIFQAIGEMVERGEPCDAVTLSEHLDRAGKADQVGGLAYLGGLSQDTPTAANIRAYANIVRERSLLRGLIRVGGEIADAGFNPEGREASALVEDAERRVYEIAESGRRTGKGFIALKSILPQALDRLDTLFHSDGDITGVATGFDDFDAKTAGLQRGDLIVVAGRPSMGKCLAHDAELVLDDGSMVTMAEMYRRRSGRVGTLGEDLKLRRAEPGGYLDDGRKPVFEVVTRLGRRVRTTITHPFRSLRGWRPLSELAEGDHIAVPRELPVFGDAPMRECEITLLACLIGDGGLTGTTPMFTSTDPTIQADFAAAVEAFGGLRLTRRTSGARAPSFAVSSDFAEVDDARTAFAGAVDLAIRASGRPARAIAAELGVTPATVSYWRNGRNVPEGARLEALAQVLGVEVRGLAGETPAAARRNRPNPLRAWLDELGLYGCSAHDKLIPEPVFRLPREQLALFLNRLFATDGWASVYASGQAQVGYATVNEKLARQVQHLLLRFGVLAKLRLRWVRYRDARRPAWQLEITHADSLSRFATEIGIHGKGAAVQAVAEAISGRRRQSNTDLIPVEVWELLEAAKGEWSWAELARRAGVSSSNIHAHRRGLSRQQLARYAMALQDAELLALADSDVYWDRIESITALGLDQVYDLTIPGTHNFIADDVCVHNTSFAMNLAEHAAIRDGVPTAIFSMEMSSEQLAFRMISSLGRVNQARLRTGNFNDEDWPRINSAVALMSNAQLFIDDSPGLTPTELRSRARRLKREFGLGLVVVDYLQLMQVAGTKENRTTEISEISRGLKALAKELEVPVIALSQLNRSVEQRHDKRPVMSDLRECVTGDTLVCLTDGRRVPIRELVGQRPRVWAVDERQRLVAAEADAVWSVGEREVLKLMLASGRVLRGTADHRVLTGSGWRTLGEIGAGERVALTNRVSAPESETRWPETAVALLGQLVGDGSYLKGAPLRYSTASEENSAIVREAAESMGSTVKRYPGRGNWHQLAIGGNGNRWQAKGVGAWLKSLGIFGQRSHEKRLPREAFRLGDEQVGLLLRHLWATDGSIHVRRPGQRGAPRVYFSTCSEHLARDVAALLLRLGIVGRIRSVTDGRGGRSVWTVDVSGAEAQHRFLERVGAFGPRKAPAEALARYLDGIRACPNTDTLPIETFETVRAEMTARGVTTRRMAAMRGTAYGGSSHFRFAPSRDTLGSYAELLDSDALRQAVASDLFWDRVVDVQPDAVEEVFDLTVPGPACWLADGVVTHNSGAIEQDADIICFIYREEVYDKETTRQGIADIIIAKQRNGPIGEVHLTFLGEYTKFENFTPERYGDGGY